MESIFFASAAEFRAWLEENHDKSQELWIGFYKKNAGKTGLTYPESVDLALCFGWIDGIRKSLDDTRYTNRFTPRKPGSNWSEKNINRVGELISEGLMHPAGLKAFEERTAAKSGVYSYEQRKEARLSDAQEEQFRANPKAWDYFQAQPPSYRQTAVWWVVSAKKEETRLKRLATLIEDSENGRAIPLLRR